MSDSDLPKLAEVLKRQLPQASDLHLLQLAECWPPERNGTSWRAFK